MTDEQRKAAIRKAADAYTEAVDYYAHGFQPRSERISRGMEAALTAVGFFDQPTAEEKPTGTFQNRWGI